MMKMDIDWMFNMLKWALIWVIILFVFFEMNNNDKF